MINIFSFIVVVMVLVVISMFFSFSRVKFMLYFFRVYNIIGLLLVWEICFFYYGDDGRNSIELSISRVVYIDRFRFVCMIRIGSIISRLFCLILRSLVLNVSG